MKVTVSALPKDSRLRSAFYVHSTSLEMMTFDERSPDNAKTWLPEKASIHGISNPSWTYRQFHNGFVDPVNNHILILCNAGDFRKQDDGSEPPEAVKTAYIRYLVSVDKGKTLLFNERIMQTDAMDTEQPLDGVRIGLNAFFLGDETSQPIRTKAGLILVPVHMTLFNAEGRPEDFGNEVSTMGYFHSLILIGSWQKDHRLKWQGSEQIRPKDPALSSRGLFEPTLVELPDGRILCVMRGSNGYPKDRNFERPSHKWYSISDDGGFRWCEPKPWRYSTEELFFSPSSTSQLIKHSSGRIYWIGNLISENAKENNPRWPLVIAQIDPQSAMLIKETVTPIDTKTPDAGTHLSLSNFQAFEDRETTDFLLPMERVTLSADYKEKLGRELMLYQINVRD